MSTQALKRKAAGSLEDSTKRLRIEEPHITGNFHSSTLRLNTNECFTEEASSPIGDDNDEDGSDYNGKDDFSDAGAGTETPVTPFSPGRKRFPSEYKTIQCTFVGCTKTFNRPARMKAHLITHTNERPFKCPYDGCDKTYIEDKHLKQHIKGTHTQERKWVCDWEGCDKSFLTGTRLRRHKEAHQGHERHRCTGYPGCNKTFRKHQTLQRHIRSDHLELAPFPCTFVDPFTNEQCNAGFDGSVGLRKHEERVHGDPQFACGICTIPNVFNLDGTPKPLAFTTETQLWHHTKKEHSDCMFCDKKCKSHRDLEKHIESQHSTKTIEERKNLQCPECDKAFTKKTNLTNHIRIVHNGERFICGTFDVSSNLALEAFDHTEDGCGRDFVSKANLEDHIRTGHLGLPSLINGNRKKAKPREPDFDMDFIDDENDDFAPKTKTKRKLRKRKTNMIDELVGGSYEADSDRNISCLDPTCENKFIGDYDLQVHMEAAQSLQAEPSMLDPTLPVVNGFQSPGTFFPGGGMTPTGDGMMTPNFSQEDVDWEMQRQVLEGGAFWVGAEDSAVQNQDNWNLEEEEMRRLIDPDYFPI